MNQYRCKKCNIVKPVSEFHKRSDRPRGIRYHCKQCALKYTYSYYRKNSQSRKEATILWAENNPTAKHEYYLKNKDKWVNYRKKRFGIPGNHTDSEWELLKKRFRHTCFGCGKQEPDIKLTKDHIVPVSRGGSDDICNIQPLCMTCNRHKYVDTKNFLKGFITINGNKFFILDARES